MELTEFLLARIAEKEAVAQAAVARNGAIWSITDLGHNGARITGATEFGNPRAYRGDDALWDDEGALGMFAETAAHVVRWDPAHVLAECTAKRQIVEEYRKTDQAANRKNAAEYFGAAYGLKRALLYLAEADSDHPDYDPGWSPSAAAASGGQAQAG